MWRIVSVAENGEPKTTYLQFDCYSCGKMHTTIVDIRLATHLNRMEQDGTFLVLYGHKCSQPIAKTLDALYKDHVCISVKCIKPKEVDRLLKSMLANAINQAQSEELYCKSLITDLNNRSEKFRELRKALEGYVLAINRMIPPGFDGHLDIPKCMDDLAEKRKEAEDLYRKIKGQ